jgi:hypothetical protein
MPAKGEGESRLDMVLVYLQRTVGQRPGLSTLSCQAHLCILNAARFPTIGCGSKITSTIECAAAGWSGDSTNKMPNLVGGTNTLGS